MIYTVENMSFKSEFDRLSSERTSVTTSFPLPTRNDDALTSDFNDGCDANVTLSPFNIIRLADAEPEDIEYIVEGILPKGHISSFYGDGGVGKSTIALGLAVCIAAGIDFAGRSVSKERVLYLDYELDQSHQCKRAKMIARDVGLDDTPADLYYASPDIHINARSSEDFFSSLKKEIDEKGITFVILDSFGAGCACDAESAKDVTRILQGLKRLGITVLIIDHQAKQQKGDSYESKSPFGSTYKGNLVRSLFQLRSESEKENELVVKLEHKKANFSALKKPIGLKVTFGEDEISIEDYPLGAQDFAGRLTLDDKVERAYRELIRASAKQVAKHLGEKEGSIQNSITRLLNREDKVIIDTGEKDGRAPIYEFIFDCDDNHETPGDSIITNSGPRDCDDDDTPPF